MLSSSWSYRKLVKEYGEDIAILLLEFMEGLGEFESNTSRWEYGQDTPCNEIHDEITSVPMTKPWELDVLDNGASGVLISLWRKKVKQENGSST